MNELIRSIEAEQLKGEIPAFNVGDTVRVYAKVVEGEKERLQMFEGVVIKRQNGGIRETFTVRRTDGGGSGGTGGIGGVAMGRRLWHNGKKRKGDAYGNHKALL